MDKNKIASELLKVAQDLLALEFPSKDALEKYLKEHPKADKRNHTFRKPIPTATPEKHKMHVEKMDKAIQKYKKKWVDNSDFDEKDKAEFTKMYKDDVKDLKKGLEHMKKGDYKSAIKLFDNLDTAVRDEIPSSVWNFLNKHTTRPDDW